MSDPADGSTAEAEDHFGWALTAGDFGRESTEDLAIGTPAEDAGAVDAGVAQVLYGTPTGLSSTGNQLWYLDSPNIPGEATYRDAFGLALAAGDFGKDPRHDLAIGIPFDHISESGSGSVIILYGSATGLTSSGVQAWSQGSSGINGSPERPDNFGYALAAANYGRGTEADLAVGVPRESYEKEGPILDSITFVGAVNVIYGGDGGLNSSGDQCWWQRSDTLKDSGEELDEFGSSLA
jgi:hypothetical protein